MYSVILLFPINGIPHICVAVVEYVQCNIVVSHKWNTTYICVAVVEYVQCNTVEPLLKNTSEIRIPG